MLTNLTTIELSVYVKAKSKSLFRWTALLLIAMGSYVYTIDYAVLDNFLPLISCLVVQMYIVSRADHVGWVALIKFRNRRKV